MVFLKEPANKLQKGGQLRIKLFDFELFTYSCPPSSFDVTVPLLLHRELRPAALLFSTYLNHLSGKGCALASGHVAEEAVRETICTSNSACAGGGAFTFLTTFILSCF